MPHLFQLRCSSLIWKTYVKDSFEQQILLILDRAQIDCDLLLFNNIVFIDTGLWFLGANRPKYHHQKHPKNRHYWHIHITYIHPSCLEGAQRVGGNLGKIQNGTIFYTYLRISLWQKSLDVEDCCNWNWNWIYIKYIRYDISITMNRL